MGTKIFLISNSFVHLPLDNLNMTSYSPSQRAQPQYYEVYDNLFYPLEAELVESFVKGVIHDIKEVGCSSWQLLLNSWIVMMWGYLEVNDDILNECVDEQAVDWYSTHFGQIHEAQHGAWDLRVSKCLGSGKEMPVDMRGNPIFWYFFCLKMSAMSFRIQIRRTIEH